MPLARTPPGWLLALCACALAPGAEADLTPLAYGDQSLSVAGTSARARVPAGHVLELVASGLEQPRMLARGPGGALFAGSKSGKVYRIPPPYTRPEVLVVLDDYPHSVAFREGEILIAQNRGLYRAPYAPGQARIEPAAVRLVAPLPGGWGHSSRTVGVGPDGRIYVSLGISGNCSDEYVGEDYPFERRRGGVLVLDEAGEQPVWRVHASGLRNPVGFDWHPPTGVMYASNNGPDHLGFEQPPESFARLEPGSFHGMPWFQFDGQRVNRDPCLGDDPPRPIEDVQAPAATFPGRNAPMGVAFVPAGALDPRLEGDAVVALRGSWGTRPSGTAFGDPASRRPPSLVVVRFDGGAARRVDPLVTGFQLADGERWARPVGVAFGDDGALYVTSDGGVNGLFRLRRAD